MHPLPFLNIGKIRNIDEFSLLCFTDGLTETFDKNQEQFGSDRVGEIFGKSLREPLPDLHADIINAVETFHEKGEFDDDITLFSCRVMKKPG
jgi:sigma-B regulation protein RsbU (phosphoserine phosphatase)